MSPVRVFAESPPDLAARTEKYATELVALRRDLHAHPELSCAEVPHHPAASASAGSGRAARSGPARGHRPGLRRRPGRRRRSRCGPTWTRCRLSDEKDVPYASTVPGVCHACGHDVHTASRLGAGAGARRAGTQEGLLPGRARLIFQPAEESPRGGALAVIEAGGIEGVERIFALHCDPRTDVGQVGAAVRRDHRLRRPGLVSG